MPHARLRLNLLLALCAAPILAGAQPRTLTLAQLDLSRLDLSRLDLSKLDLSQVDLSQLDPSAIAAGASDTLMRAPDGSIDELFQALHQASRHPRDAATLCALFDPAADRSPQALASAAQNLGDASRQGFANALLGIAANGLQNPRQPYDAGAAKQTLKSAGTTAMLLHDGFMGALNADASEPGGREARCQAFGWLLDALKGMPRAQRASAMRLMLNEGLTRWSPPR